MHGPDDIKCAGKPTFSATVLNRLFTKDHVPYKNKAHAESSEVTLAMKPAVMFDEPS
jgi:hypothetical protein